MFKISTTASFEKRIRYFIQTHPELKKKIAEVLRQLSLDPFEPKLKLHSLKGPMTGLHAVRINYSYRVILMIKITRKEITLLDIGSHDEVY